MTVDESIQSRVMDLIAAEVDPRRKAEIVPGAGLRSDLHFLSSQRYALCFAIAGEFGIRLDHAAYDAIASPSITVEGVCHEVARILSSDARSAGAVR
jgi:hypothetical protein